MFKRMTKTLGFTPMDGEDNVWIKHFDNENYAIKIDFKTNTIDYGKKITVSDKTTSNFSKNENFVVLECVVRLLKKGYNPSRIILENKWLVGKKEKGKLDILIKDEYDKPYLMIECKTYGKEFNKEVNKMKKDGGQLFSYFIQNKNTKYLCLYTSIIKNDEVKYENKIVKVENSWRYLGDIKEIHAHWNKSFKDNGIFEKWVKPYDIVPQSLVRGNLKGLTSDDSNHIYYQFLEILRHNNVSDKPNAFNKILNLFICKIIDEDKLESEVVDFQWLESDTFESLQLRLNDLYRIGMKRFLGIEVTDYSENELDSVMIGIFNDESRENLRKMFSQLRLQKNSEFSFKEVYNEQSFEENAIVVKEIVELLQPYQFRYGHKQQFLGNFFELLLNTSIKQEVGQYFTPVPIAKFIITSLPIEEVICRKVATDEQNVLPYTIDFASGSGHFLTEFMDELQLIINSYDTNNMRPTLKITFNSWKNNEFSWANEYIYGIDADYRLVKTSKVSSFLNGDGEANIIQANGLDNFSSSINYVGKLKNVCKDNSMDNKSYDILIANPPYGVKAFKNGIKDGEKSFDLYKNLTDFSSEIECLFIERAKQLLNEKGIAGIILPNSFLTNTNPKTYPETRAILLKYFKIIGIVELGKNTFMATNTSTIILFLEKRNDDDYRKAESAIEEFIKKRTDFTVLSQEKIFSKYVEYTYHELSFKDYITLLGKNPNIFVKKSEMYNNYFNEFRNCLLYKDLLKDKNYKNSSNKDMIVEEKFINYCINSEKEKILYFILTTCQKTIVVSAKEGKLEKKFLGYEFSNRKNSEGIKYIENEDGSLNTLLYDENAKNSRASSKINYYIYKNFLNEIIDIDESLSEYVEIHNLVDLIDFSEAKFNKIIKTTPKIEFKSKFEKKELAEIAPLTRGVVYDKDKDLSIEKTNNIVLTADNISLNGQLEIKKEIFLKDTFNVQKSTKLKKDDILISLSSGSKKHIGKVAFIEEDMNYHAGGFLGILRPDNNKVNLYYLYALLSSKKGKEVIQSLAFGSNIFNITNSIERIKIPLPQISEQNKIGEDISNAVNMIKYYQNELNNIHGKLLNDDFYRYKKIKLKEIKLNIFRGKSAKYGDSNIQIIKSGQARGYNKFDFKEKYFVSKNFINDNRNLQKGDLLLNSTGVGTAGRVTLFNLDGNYVADSHITIIRLNKKLVNTKYIMYSLAHFGFKNIENIARGQSGQIELTYDMIDSLEVSYPQIEIQNKIVNQIEALEEQMASIEDNIQKQYEIIEETINLNLN
ncbi:TPA: N-6 DNA methylase [Clostridioides difficile]|nr:N-6 DNA methylase [Clostridioides difficile]